MDPQQAQDLVRHTILTMFPVIALFWLIKITLYIIPLWQTAKKAGLNPAVAFLAAIPLVGRLIALYVIGFSEWRPIAPPDIYAYPPPTQQPPPPYTSGPYPPQSV